VQLTHDLLVRLVIAINTDEYGQPDPHIPPFLPHTTYTSCEQQLAPEQIAPRFQAYIAFLRETDSAGARLSGQELLRRLCVDDEGRPARPTVHEVWWEHILLWLNPLFLVDQVRARGEAPPVETFARELFCKSSAWSLSPELRNTLAARGRAFVESRETRQSALKEARPRVEIDEGRRQILIDGRAHDVQSAKALRFIIGPLIAARGAWVGGKELDDPAVAQARPDKAIGRLPDAVKAIIETRKGGAAGYRIKPEFFE